MRAGLLVISLAILIAGAMAAGDFKTLTGVNLGGFGTVASEDNGIKKIVGVNIE
jgi:hypothetical protein